ncbi:hypothetical protein [Lyngbya aestuarii]|uniref:hypothetical protein n=1 Tax=Lyngbya aestuarii TaxID=118322 RepID=UPI00403DB40F
MHALKTQAPKKTNPKREKRRQYAKVGNPRVPLHPSKSNHEPEKLSDWENAS